MMAVLALGGQICVYNFVCTLIGIDILCCVCWYVRMHVGISVCVWVMCSMVALGGTHITHTSTCHTHKHMSHTQTHTTHTNTHHTHKHTPHTQTHITHTNTHHTHKHTSHTKTHHTHTHTSHTQTHITHTNTHHTHKHISLRPLSLYLCVWCIYVFVYSDIYINACIYICL